METALRAVVRYDGTHFAGWQKQPGKRTVQGVLESAMSRIAGQPVRVQGASRTDAGVHALGQVCSCRWPGPFPARLRRALSRMLGPEIRVTELTETTPDFNARFSARAKRYAYSLDLGREADPLSARYAWHVPYRVELERVRALLPLVEGAHDFAGFQSAGSPAESTVRTIFSARLESGGLIQARDAEFLWRIELYGDAFLYHMVRNITGTLIEVARGRFPPAFFEACLKRRGPFQGYCAPAHGLTLVCVAYEESGRTAQA